MNFSEAMEAAILDGKRVARAAWAIEQDTLTYVEYSHRNNDFTDVSLYGPHGYHPYLAGIELADLLAHDWEIW